LRELSLRQVTWFFLPDVIYPSLTRLGAVESEFEIEMFTASFPELEVLALGNHCEGGYVDVLLVLTFRALILSPDGGIFRAQCLRLLARLAQHRHKALQTKLTSLPTDPFRKTTTKQNEEKRTSETPTAQPRA